MRDGRVDEAGSSARPRRVLILTDSLDNGGLERQLDLLARSLPETWQVRVASLRDGPYAEVLRGHGIQVTIAPRAFRLDVSPAWKVGAIVREWRPDVVHSYGWLSTLAAMPWCRTLGVPVVDSSIRDGAPPARRGAALRRAAMLADVAIANSQAGLDSFGIPMDRGRVVRNGFDPERWALCTRESGRGPGDPFTVVMTGRMHAHKDWRTYLDAARVLGVEDPGGWRFLAVGFGPQREELEAEYAELSQVGVVEFTESGTEVLGLVSSSDVGVLLTNAELHAEGIANSIMEYMACGLPAIGTDGGGNPELIVDGETGLLVPPSDVDALVAALCLLRDDPERARRMGEAGRARIREVFTVDGLVSRTLAAYELAASRRERR